MSVITSVEDVTSDWLAGVFGTEVRLVASERVGAGQIGSCHRLHLSSTDPGVAATVLLKLPTDDPGSRELLAGAYRTEVRFYAELAADLAVRIPACLYATDVEDDGRFVLLLEDLAPAEQGDQLRGCTPDEATAAAVNLAGLHAPRWCDPELLDLGWITASGPEEAATLAELYGPTVETFLDQLGPLVSSETADTLRAAGPVIEAWALARRECFAPVHGDYRLDNLLFPPDDPEGVIAVDWQTLSIGLPARDLAYLLGTGLSVEDRRSSERAIVERYVDRLGALGVSSYDEEQCWEDYRLAMIQGPLVTVFGCAYGARSERGDRMFAVMADRSCTAIRDLGTLALLG